MITYRYIHSGDPSSDIPHQITAHDNGRQIGHLEWHPEVEDIFVEEPYRRQGIATQMWNHAEHMSEQFTGTVMRPLHSAQRTREGQAWALSVSNPEELPEWERVGRNR